MLSAADVALLRRFRLSPRGLPSGLYPGRHRSRRMARSPEFADFRPYAAGDDFRQIDWTAFARLEKLVLRLYVAEDEVCLNVVLDDSRSMALGEPSKWEASKQLAAGLSFLGLNSLDRVAVGSLSGRVSCRHLRGRHGLQPQLEAIQSIRPVAQASWPQVADLKWMRPGLTVLISDFLGEADESPAFNQSVLARLAARGQEAVLWQVLSPEEEEPKRLGDVRLLGVESGRRLDLTVTRSRIRDYRLALDDVRSSLRSAAQSVGGWFLRSRSSDRLSSMIRQAADGGLVRNI